MFIALRSAAASLTLDADERGWCRVRLRLGSRDIALGAESRNIVIERLDRALLDPLPGEEAGQLDGVPFRWVLSLFEEHATIYAAEVDGVRRLHFQAGDGQSIGRIDLTRDQRREWSNALRSPQATSKDQE